MKLKTYRSETIDAAMRLAGVELGEEAIFVASRESGAKEGQGRYEVTFALLESDAAAGPIESRAERGNLAREPSRVAQAAQRPNEGRAQSGVEPRAAAAGPPEKHPDNTRKKIELPHWKRFVPHELEACPANNSVGSLGSEAGRERVKAERVRIVGASSTEVASESQPTPPHEAEPTAQTESQRVHAAKGEASLGLTSTAVTAADVESRSRNTASAAHKGEQQDAAVHSMSPGARPSRDEEISPSPSADRAPSTLTAQVHDELRLIRSLLESDLSRRFLRAFSQPALVQDPAAVRLLARMVASELEPRLLDQLLSSVGSGGPQAESRIRSKIEELCPVSPQIAPVENLPQTAAFVGPSGCGKTTAVAKLAVQQGWDEGRRVHLVIADPHRVAHGELLRSYARLAQIPLTTINKAERITTFLDNLAAAGQDQAPEIVLIDTPSYAPSDWERAERLAGALQSTPGIEIHLVVDLSRRSLGRLRERYSIFQPANLLFTKLDEAMAYGDLLNESLRTGIPLSFLCDGPGVPEDICPATKECVANLILGAKA